ncbi:hypothetical protein EBB07_05475 [Paenibacillaceae bacterium]|nr:hypothetical protein EBB07_05475 [Paenibacillaceae bacterium]
MILNGLTHMIFRYMTSETTPLSGVVLSLYSDVNVMVKSYFVLRYYTESLIISRAEGMMGEYSGISVMRPLK